MNFDFLKDPKFIHTMIGVGKAVGDLSAAGDKLKLTATEKAMAPWTNMAPTQFKPVDPLGTVMQGAMAGITEDEATKDREERTKMREAYLDILKNSASPKSQPVDPKTGAPIFNKHPEGTGDFMGNAQTTAMTNTNAPWLYMGLKRQWG